MSLHPLPSSQLHTDFEHIGSISNSFWERLNLLLDTLPGCPKGRGRKAWIALAVGVSRPAIQAWENGRKPRESNVEQLCEFLLSQYELLISPAHLQRFLQGSAPEIDALQEMSRAGLSGQMQALIYVAAVKAMEHMALSPTEPENEKTWALVALRVGRFYASMKSNNKDVDADTLERVARAYLTLALEGAI